MNEQHKNSVSKFLSLVLRHQPEAIGLTLDESGWVEVSALLTKLTAHGRPLTKDELEIIVATNAKQRFAFNDDQSMIRANQGHSIEVALQLTAQEPPEYLHHGTVEKFIAAIRREGLRKMSRQHVHLSADKETAEKVGSRRGRPIILTISSGTMHRNGAAFYQSQNGVWLTDAVPVDYIDFSPK